jgi:hypothetical protein
MQADPFQANRELERELCAFTGAPYAVTVNSCTMAILLACAWVREQMLPRVPMFSIPRRTYIGVPMSIANARCGVTFHDEDWQGEYELKMLPDDQGLSVWDSARRFTSDMFTQSVSYETRPASGGLLSGEETIRMVKPLHGRRFQCVSHHITKILGHSQGGTILHNVSEADAWLRRARFDGRTEGVPATEDHFDMIGWHAYMSPDVAAALRWKLASLPRHNADLPRDNYPDLSLAPIFSGKTPG